MSKYRCDSCMIWCKCEIPDECDFIPEVCLAQLDKQYYKPNWTKDEEASDDRG